MSVPELPEAQIDSSNVLHYKGQRKDEYAISVTGNYRLTFRFENGEAHDVNLEDYH